MSVRLSALLYGAALGPVVGLVGLWLRLSWRTRQERARRRTLVTLAQTLRRNSWLEEQMADGTVLRIVVDDSRQGDGRDREQRRGLGGDPHEGHEAGEPR